MKTKSFRSSSLQIQSLFVLIVAAISVLLPRLALAQGLTGTLIGTVKDEQGAAVPGGQVRITSQALIGGPRILLTTEAGQFHFLSLTPGAYTLDIEMPGFA